MESGPLRGCFDVLGHWGHRQDARATLLVAAITQGFGGDVLGEGGLWWGLEFEDGGGHGAAELELAGGVVVDGVGEEGEVVGGDHAGAGDGVGMAGGGVGVGLAGADFGAVGEARERWVVGEDLAEDQGDWGVLVGVLFEALFEEPEGGGIIGG